MEDINIELREVGMGVYVCVCVYVCAGFTLLRTEAGREGFLAVKELLVLYFIV
jgi:hypothetical protein